MAKDDFLKEESAIINQRLLTRDEILEVQDIKSEVVEVPEWGGSVKVQGMTGTERDDFEGALLKGKGKNVTVNMQNIRAKLVAHSIVNGNGDKMFNDGDVRALGSKSAAALDRVFEVASELSGISQADVEELAKNLGSDQSENSGSN